MNKFDELNAPAILELIKEYISLEEEELKILKTKIDLAPPYLDHKNDSEIYDTSDYPFMGFHSLTLEQNNVSSSYTIDDSDLDIFCDIFPDISREYMYQCIGSKENIDNYFNDPQYQYQEPLNYLFWPTFILTQINNSKSHEIINQLLFYFHKRNETEILSRIYNTISGWLTNHLKTTDLSLIKFVLDNPYLKELNIHADNDSFFQFYLDHNDDNILYYLVKDYQIGLNYNIQEMLLKEDRSDLLEMLLNNEPKEVIIYNEEDCDEEEILNPSDDVFTNIYNEEDSDEEEIFNPSDDVFTNKIKEEQDTLTQDDDLLTWLPRESLKLLEKHCHNNHEKSEQIKNYLFNLSSKKPMLKVKDLSIFNDVLNKAPNFKEVIKYFKGSFILNQSRQLLEKSYIIPKPVLLLGDPGIGKTYFAKILAKALNTSFFFLDANCITANWVLSGSSGSWRNAEAGNIFQYMKSSKTVSPLVIFDEIDKMTQGGSYSTFSVFHQLLEPENSCSFQDEFLGVSFDASHIIYILTANNINDIPESLLSRMKVFDVQAPDVNATRIIAQNMYSDLIGTSALFNPILNEKSLLVLEKMVPRKIQQILSASVFNQAAEIEGEYGQDLIVLTDIKEQHWGF